MSRSFPARVQLLVGGILVGIAVAVGLTLTPPLRTPPSRPASTAPSPGPHVPYIVLGSLGPLHPGDTFGDGLRVTRIIDVGDAARVELAIPARDGLAASNIALGLEAPGANTATPLVPMPDLFVSYYGEPGGGDPSAPIRALAEHLRSAAGGRPLHERVSEWKRSAPHVGGVAERGAP